MAMDSSISEEERILLHDERSCIFETRVERASLCRDHGSTAFKAKDISKAITWYERALYHVDFDEGTWHFEFLDKHRDLVNDVRLPVHLNLAICYLGRKSEGENDVNIDKVIEHTDAALVIDKTNAKALYRGGKAYLLRGDLAQAKTKLKQAAQLQPKDKYIREALEEVSDKLAIQRAKEKETWGGRLLKTTDISDKDDTDDSSRATSSSVSDSSVKNSSFFSSRITLSVLLAVTVAVIGILLVWTQDMFTNRHSG